MNKKEYISPAMVSVALNVKEGFLGVSGGDTLGEGGSAEASGISEGATKGQGDYDVWDE